jgi:hypothetical protein
MSCYLYLKGATLRSTGVMNIMIKLQISLTTVGVMTDFSLLKKSIFEYKEKKKEYDLNKHYNLQF